MPPKFKYTSPGVGFLDTRFVNAAGDSVISGDLIPTDDSSIDLGSSSKYWAEGYFDKLYLNATATLSGATAGEIHIVGDVGIGTISPTSDLTLGGDETISTTSNSDLILLPNGTGITKIGDAGGTSHTLNTNDDLLVTGKLEVNGITYFDGSVYVHYPFYIGNAYNADSLYVMDGGNNYNLIIHNKTDDGLHFAIGNVDGAMNRNFIFVDRAFWNKDYDHDTLSVNPTLFGHAVTNPDITNNQFWSLTHDQQGMVITTGAQVGAGTGVAQACTATNATNLFTDVAHILSDDDRIMIGGDAVPTGIDSTVIYFVISDTTDTFQISLTSGGAAVTFSDDGTNVTWSYASDNYISFQPRGTEAVRITGAGVTEVGDGTNQLLISHIGVVTLEGTAKRILTLRAALDETRIQLLGKPTQVVIGVFHGYSVPIYAADPGGEELFFNENVPGRWDGASDITFHVLVALASAETEGETFKFQLSWNQVGATDVVPVTITNPTDEVTVVDGTQYATYELTFTIDYDADAGDAIVSHDDLATRLRRVASTGDEVDGEIIVLDWHTHYNVDKMFKAP